MFMRKLLKALHTVAAGGLIGGVLAYMVLLLEAKPDTAAAYAELRWQIATLSNYILMPSLAIALVSGLLSMAVHRPYLDKRWVWAKAALGILMFKGVLTIVGAKADYAAAMSELMAKGQAPADALDTALAYEWHTLWAILAMSVANVVFGVWRPRLGEERRAGARRRPLTVPKTEEQPLGDEPLRPAA